MQFFSKLNQKDLSSYLPLIIYYTMFSNLTRKGDYWLKTFFQILLVFDIISRLLLSRELYYKGKVLEQGGGTFGRRPHSFVF